MPDLWDYSYADRGPRLVDGKVMVRMGRYGPYGLELLGIQNERASKDQPGAVRICIWNLQTEKVRFAFTLHAWWLRIFVYDLARAVAIIEREFDTLPEAYVKAMEEDQG